MDTGAETRDVQAKSIFLNALDIAATEDRLSYLDRRCGRDAALRAEVETLLRHHEGLGDYVERPVLDPPATREVAVLTTRLGRRGQAQQLFQEATRWMIEINAETHEDVAALRGPLAWATHLALRVLHNEAQQVLKEDSGVKGQKSK
jgi:hypothetical protein